MLRMNLSILVLATIVAMFATWAARSDAQVLAASVSVDLSGMPTWNYTITNLELSTSGLWLTSFYLPISAPVSDVQSPNGWTLDTDDATYILWSNLEAPPYPHDVAPGDILSGFQFVSTAVAEPAIYQVDSWDHINDVPGLNASGEVLAPSAVPEPGTITWLSTVTLSGVMLLIRRRR